jgi:RNA-directed DNA polymerase
VLWHFNLKLVAWAKRKYKRFKGSRTQAAIFLGKIAERQPQMFTHWKMGMVRFA